MNSEDRKYASKVTEKTVIAYSAPRLPVGESKELLVTLRGGRLGEKYELDRRRVITLGRDIAADIMLEDDAASRNHCHIFFSHGQWFIEDCHSTNGTYVGVGRVDPQGPQQLRDGDLIKIGSTIYKFLSTSNIETAYYEEIYRMAIFDSLTQIHNRRYFEEFCDIEISRCRRHKRPLTLLLFDVDKFKSINDGFGHLAGDHVLRTIASQISARIRKEELFARYAGDEFVVLLPESQIEGGLSLAENLRQIVEQADCRFEGQDIHATISIGVATFNDEMTTCAHLVAASDAALYRAKEMGRNSVSI